MFEVQFQTKEGRSSLVWQNSWGLTTRSIGVMVMIHGDDKGLVLPPRVAPVQVVVIPIFLREMKTEHKDSALHLSDEEEEFKLLLLHTQNIQLALESAGIKVHVDKRLNVSPGYKFNHWEMKD